TQLLHQWNATAMARPTQACVHDLVSERARRSPDAVAVVCQEESLTYSELDARANRLAHWLIARGGGREGRGAVLMERTPALLVAVLAIWKAGAAYVPLDRDAPPARNDAIAADADVRAVLGPGLPWEEMANQQPTAPTVAVAQSQLAYVLYTSGSTGAP